MPYLQIQVSDSVYAKIEKLRKSKYQRNDLVEVAVAKVFEKDENFIDFISTFRIDLKTIEKVPMAISLRKEIYSYFESLSNQTEIQLGIRVDLVSCPCLESKFVSSTGILEQECGLKGPLTLQRHY